MTKPPLRYFNAEENDKSTKVPKRKKNTGIKKQKDKLKDDIVTINVDYKRPRWMQKYQMKDPKKHGQNPNPKYPGRAPVNPEALARHSRGEGLSGEGVKTGYHLHKLKRKEKNIEFASEQAARTELLLTEQAGFLEADDGETTTQFTQKQIADSVDISAATKHFELKLDQFGPYRLKYSRGGRHLLLGGYRGHVAAMDWATKRLHCEMNVMETVHDVSWLHIETMMAVAQKDWVYMYDNQGIELHCIKRLNKVTRMEFLPYHFLLATASGEGYLSWLDISIGELVTQVNSKLGRLTMLTHNPHNAVLCVGHARGVVSMWSPNSREPLAKMLCHKTPMTGVTVDPRGIYMATSAIDCSLKVWDIRKLHGPLQIYKTRAAANSLTISHKGCLAVAMGNVVEVYRECCTQSAERPYLRQRMSSTVSSMQFCPHEDVLGVGTQTGFTSLLVPGSGEANFDALESNPFQTKSQRRETEVRSLLEKIPAALITLDPAALAEVDVPTLQDKIEAKKKLLFLKPPKIDYNPRNISKRKGGSAQIARNKKIVQEETRREFVKTMKDVNPMDGLTEPKPDVPEKSQGVLDRFRPKKKTTT